MPKIQIVTRKLNDSYVYYIIKRGVFSSQFRYYSFDYNSWFDTASDGTVFNDFNEVLSIVRQLFDPKFLSHIK
jgi:hypothetical protein